MALAYESHDMSYSRLPSAQSPASHHISDHVHEGHDLGCELWYDVELCA